MKSYLHAGRDPKSVPLHVLAKAEFSQWQEKQPQARQRWCEISGFEGKVAQYIVLPGENGEVESVVTVVPEKLDTWSLAHLPGALPEGRYHPVFVDKTPDAETLQQLALGWQLATYRFQEYKAKTQSDKKYATLVLPETCDTKAVDQLAEGIFLVRDLVNRPANDLTPFALAEAAKALADAHSASYEVIEGDALLEHNYPLIHAVGRASVNPPCLIDLRWGNENAPKVTLVGKGICFDSGGLDIKPSSGMKLMKKDMGGAAQVLGLAHAIMAAELPVRLRVLVAAAENSVSGNAFRPMDIITSRKGTTVEIGNTDAEGRLVLCDALAEADSEKPDLLVDCATLTGAARVALGTEVPAFFTGDDALATALEEASKEQYDPLWRLPLWEPYREQLNSDAADLNNAPEGGYGGAITAALYLKEFIEHTPRWIHIDLMAWNLRSRPGRPTGGEAMGMRALFSLICSQYGNI